MLPKDRQVVIFVASILLTAVLSVCATSLIVSHQQTDEQAKWRKVATDAQKQLNQVLASMQRDQEKSLQAATAQQAAFQNSPTPIPDTAAAPPVAPTVPVENNPQPQPSDTEQRLRSLEQTRLEQEADQRDAQWRYQQWQQQQYLNRQIRNYAVGSSGRVPLPTERMEIRTVGGKDYKQLPNGQWVPLH